MLTPKTDLCSTEDLHQLPLEEKQLQKNLNKMVTRPFYAGKWHLGSEGYYPEQNGFDINVGGFEKGSPIGGGIIHYKNPKLEDGQKFEYSTRSTHRESNFFSEKSKS